MRQDNDTVVLLVLLIQTAARVSNQERRGQSNDEAIQDTGPNGVRTWS